MRILLDTHDFLWLIVAPSKLSRAFCDLIKTPSNEIYLSVISLLEITIKYRLGNLPLSETPEILIPKQRQAHRITSLILDEGAIFEVGKLPSIDRDPFDRLLIGQALQHDLRLATVDPDIFRYPVFLIDPRL